MTLESAASIGAVLLFAAFLAWTIAEEVMRDE